MSIFDYDCIYRLLQDENCRGCITNYNPNDPLANLYCPRYYPATRIFGSANTIIDQEVRKNIIEEMKQLYRRQNNGKS